MLRTILTDDFNAALSLSATLDIRDTVTPVTVTLHPEFQTRIPELLLSEGRAFHLDQTGVQRKSTVCGNIETVQYDLFQPGRDLTLTLTRVAGAYAGRTMVTNRLMRHT